MTQPWPWWLCGVMIGSVVPLLYFLGGKWFGMSTSLQQLGALCTPRSPFQYLQEHDKVQNAWTLVFAGGIALGAFLATQWLVQEPVELLPAQYHSVGGAVRLLLGGFLIGFGARYAGGCTSGHAITGISNLNPPSVMATLSFFAGGLAVTWLTDWLVF